MASSDYRKKKRRTDPKWREAHNKKKREYYHKHDQEERLKHGREAYARCRDWTHAIKRIKGCLYCEESDPCCLDFHHRDPDTKLFSIGSNVARARKTLQVEIDKCDVVCSNCHRKLTWAKTQP